MNDKIEYISIRSQVKTGDLYFVPPYDLIGLTIQAVTRSDLIHVGMFVVLGGRVFAVECMYGMKCRMMLASERLKKKFVFVQTDTIETEIFTDNLLSEVGVTGYNIFGVLISWFTRYTRKGRSFCSEWVARRLGLTFPHLFRNIYPIDIYEHYMSDCI